MIPTTPPWRFGLLAFGVMLASLGSFGQDADSADNSALECISLARVIRTEVVDEQTIRFHLRGQQSYSNYLPQECPGLDDRARFTYETTSNRLCNADLITLLEQGSRLTPGISCRLGKFVPASAEAIVDLTGDESRSARGNAIEVRRVELEEADSSTTATPPTPSTDPPTAPDRVDR